MGHCEIDPHANQSYEELFKPKGEVFYQDAKTIEPEGVPEFELLCAGFPCQPFSMSGKREGFCDPRGTLFYEIARVVGARRPALFLLENVPGLLSHDKGRTYSAILQTLSELGYRLEWTLLNSKDFGVPQSRLRLYLIGYLDGRCAGKILPVGQTNPTPLKQILPGRQGERVYETGGLACNLTAGSGGFGGKTGLYAEPLPCLQIKGGAKGFTDAYPGDGINMGFLCNTRKCRVMHGLSHTLLTSGEEGTVTWCRRIRRLMPIECWRLQGYTDEQFYKAAAVNSDSQLYKQAGNGVTIPVIEAIGKNIRKVMEQINQ